jgi:hypothetical protein
MNERTRKEIERLEAGGDSWEASTAIKEPVSVKQPLDKVLQVRLSEEQWLGLRSRAHDIGIGPATLMRMWVVEKLREAEPARR